MSTELNRKDLKAELLEKERKALKDKNRDNFDGGCFLLCFLVATAFDLQRQKAAPCVCFAQQRSGKRT